MTQPSSNETILEAKLTPPLEWQSLKEVSKIGKGANGIVFKYQNLKNPNQYFAVKKLYQIDDDLDLELKIEKEINVLQIIGSNDEFFPKYYGHVKLKNTNIEWALVSELAVGNLEKLLKINDRFPRKCGAFKMSHSWINLLERKKYCPSRHRTK